MVLKLKRIHSLRCTLQISLLVGLFFADLASAQQDGLLYRGDDRRSAFAGSQLERVQSFSSPARAESNPAPEDVQKAPEAPVIRPGPRLQSRGLEAGPTGSLRVPQGNSPLPPGFYKSVPIQGIYLNGTNIVGLRSQTLRDVTVRFDAQGNIFIDAPQYDIRYDSSYHPLLPAEGPAYSKEEATLPQGKPRSLDLP